MQIGQPCYQCLYLKMPIAHTGYKRKESRQSTQTKYKRYSWHVLNSWAHVNDSYLNILLFLKIYNQMMPLMILVLDTLFVSPFSF